VLHAPDAVRATGAELPPGVLVEVEVEAIDVVVVLGLDDVGATLPVGSSTGAGSVASGGGANVVVVVLVVVLVVVVKFDRYPVV